MAAETKPISIADVKYKRRKTIPVDVGNEVEPCVVEVTYSPDLWTRQFVAEMEAPKENGEPCDKFDRTERIVNGLVTAWSLSDPVTPETVNNLGYFIQNTMVVAIMKDINGGDETDPKENPDDSNGG